MSIILDIIGKFEVMSGRMDKLRTPHDLGLALKASRLERRLKTIAIAQASGRSRDVLNRLEKGQDVTLQSLFDILRAMGLCLRIEAAGLPTLEEMRARFAEEEDDGAP